MTNFLVFKYYFGISAGKDCKFSCSYLNLAEKAQENPKSTFFSVSA